MASSVLASSRFWQQTAIRCLKTFAQGAGGVLGATAAGVMNVDIKQAAVAGLGAAFLALLMSLEKLEELPADNPEDAAVDAMMEKTGISSSSPLPEPKPVMPAEEMTPDPLTQEIPAYTPPPYTPSVPQAYTPPAAPPPPSRPAYGGAP